MASRRAQSATRTRSNTDERSEDATQSFLVALQTAMAELKTDFRQELDARFNALSAQRNNGDFVAQPTLTLNSNVSGNANVESENVNSEQTRDLNAPIENETYGINVNTILRGNAIARFEGTKSKIDAETWISIF